MSAARNFIELDFPASSDFLALARQVVGTAARADGGFGEERLENLQLAVSEACTNAVPAHSAAGSEAAIHIRCELADGRIEVEVVDRGPGFDPEDLPALPAPTDPSRLDHESGLGIPLMQRVHRPHRDLFLAARHRGPPRALRFAGRLTGRSLESDPGGCALGPH